MTRKLTFGMIACIALTVVLSVSIVAQAPAGGGGRGPGRGMMGDMMYLERSWTAVSFKLDCTTEQIAALKPTYRNALNDRDAKIKAAMEAQNWEGMGTAISECKTRLEAKLKEVLSATQMTKLTESMTRRGRPGAGGRGPGGPGGGGAQ